MLIYKKEEEEEENLLFYKRINKHKDTSGTRVNDHVLDIYKMAQGTTQKILVKKTSEKLTFPTHPITRPLVKSHNY